MQNTIEVADNTDNQTGFYNKVYLYSNSRKILMKSTTSSATLIELINIPELNEKYGRNLGNTLILKMCNEIRNIVSKESVLIRYEGLKFLIITPDSNAQIAQPIIEKVLHSINNISEYVEDEEIKIEANILIHTLQKQNNIEKEIQKMKNSIHKFKDTNTIKIM
jgi:diguanylate cyclase (GGDEF)-like protein